MHILFIIYTVSIRFITFLNILIKNLITVDIEKAYENCLTDFCTCESTDVACQCSILSALADLCTVKVITFLRLYNFKMILWSQLIHKKQRNIKVNMCHHK